MNHSFTLKFFVDAENGSLAEIWPPASGSTSENWCRILPEVLKHFGQHLAATVLAQRQVAQVRGLEGDVVASVRGSSETRLGFVRSNLTGIVLGCIEAKFCK